MINDLFNWYMSYAGDDIQLTYRPDYDRCYLSTGFKSEFIDSMLASDASKNEWGLIKYVFDKYGLDHTSANPYKYADIDKVAGKFIVEDGLGGTTYKS